MKNGNFGAYVPPPPHPIELPLSLIPNVWTNLVTW